jgi:hypothetical protein
MPRSGFHAKLREFLASDEFESAIDNFLRENAASVIGVSKATSSSESKTSSPDVSKGEFTLEAHSRWQGYLDMVEGMMSK